MTSQYENSMISQDWGMLWPLCGLKIFLVKVKLWYTLKVFISKSKIGIGSCNVWKYMQAILTVDVCNAGLTDFTVWTKILEKVWTFKILRRLQEGL